MAWNGQYIVYYDGNYNFVPAAAIPAPRVSFHWILEADWSYEEVRNASIGVTNVGHSFILILNFNLPFWFIYIFTSNSIKTGPIDGFYEQDISMFILLSDSQHQTKMLGLECGTLEMSSRSVQSHTEAAGIRECNEAGSQQ